MGSCGRLSAVYHHEESSVEETDLIMRYSADSQVLHRMVIKHWVIREFSLEDRSRRNWVRLIEEIRSKGVPVREACEWPEVSRSSYFRRRSIQEIDDEDSLVSQIREFQQAHNYAYGAKRMAMYLSQKNNKAINHKRIARLMKIHGLNSKVRPRRYFQHSTTISRSKEHVENLPERNFKSNKPFEKWVTDMTYIPVVEGWLVLSAIKDLCSHKIVAAAFGNSATIEWARETIQQLPKVNSFSAMQSLLHSDQGSCYSSEQYRMAVKAIGIRVSYPRKGNCLDNASIESFFGHMKSETFYRLNPSERLGLTREKAKKIVEAYIRWYNEERIQHSLGYRSPEEVILSFDALQA